MFGVRAALWPNYGRYAWQARREFWPALLTQTANTGHWQHCCVNATRRILAPTLLRFWRQVAAINVILWRPRTPLIVIIEVCVKKKSSDIGRTAFFRCIIIKLCPKNVKKITRVKPISTKRFSFYPCISYLYKAVKKKTFYLWKISDWNLLGG